MYRISHVDKNGDEVPDPAAPPDSNEDPRRLWPTASVTPSIPPPAPNVTLGDPTDLSIKLFWLDYEFPDDFEIFRVFVAALDSGGNPLDFRLLVELVGDRKLFFDTSFKRDEITKIYRVVAVDRFGVEGGTEIVAASPNLPPAPPQGVQARVAFRLDNKYDVLITWEPNEEPDLDGYQIYATRRVTGNLIVGDDLVSRKIVPPETTRLIIRGEDPLLFEQLLVVRRYFITAFDDTRAPGRSRDESEAVEAIILEE